MTDYRPYAERLALASRAAADQWERTRREIDEVIASSFSAYPARHMTGLPYVPRPTTPTPHERENTMPPFGSSNPFDSISPYPSLTASARTRYVAHIAPDGTMGVLDTSYDEFAALGRGTSSSYARARALDLNGRIVPRSRYSWVPKHTLKATPVPTRYTVETLVEAERKVVIIRDSDYPGLVAKYGMSTVAEVQTFADRLNRGLKSRSSLNWTEPRPRFSVESLGGKSVIVDAVNAAKVANFGAFGESAAKGYVKDLNSGKRTTGDFSWTDRGRLVKAFRDDKVKVGAKVRLTSTSDADYKVELKVGELVTKHGVTVALKADSKGHPFTADAYTVEVLQEAPAELPTKPGIYAREGSLAIYDGGVQMFRRYADGSWLVTEASSYASPKVLSETSLRDKLAGAKLVELVEAK